MNGKLGMIAVVTVSFVMVVLSFFAGAYYQRGKDNVAANNGSGQMDANNAPRGNFPGGAGGAGGPGGMGRPGGQGGTAGTVTAVSGNSVTITIADGSTKTVSVSGDATITKSEKLTSNDIAVGQTIRVIEFNDPSGNGARQIITVE